MTLDEILALARPVMPVLVIDRPEQAMPLAEALLGGGVHVLELTLRSDAALDAIRLLSRALPNVACVGGSWLATPEQLARGDWAGITAAAARSRQLDSRWSGA